MRFSEAEYALQKLKEKWYKEGYKDAVTNYAVWRDGEQFIGVLQRPLKTVFEEIDSSKVPIEH